MKTEEEKEADEERFDPIIRIKESGGKERSGEDKGRVRDGLTFSGGRRMIKEESRISEREKKKRTRWALIGRFEATLNEEQQRAFRKIMKGDE
jgi:hypothetical protein